MLLLAAPVIAFWLMHFAPINQNFGVDGLTWLRPTSVLSPRFPRFVIFDF